MVYDHVTLYGHLIMISEKDKRVDSCISAGTTAGYDVAVVGTKHHLYSYILQEYVLFSMKIDVSETDLNCHLATFMGG